MEVRAVAALWAVVLALLSTDAAATFCPTKCMCSTTVDGLHKAVCSDVDKFENYVKQRDHSNINILDLSHNNITNLTINLDRLTEIVSLDLSTNGFSVVYPDSLHSNLTKLVHLNLANNRIKYIHLGNLPISISSLDLSNNLLKNIPSDIETLPHLEHIQLEGNPINCSCRNILLRDNLLVNRIALDSVKCAQPAEFEGMVWFVIKSTDVCDSVKNVSAEESNNLKQELVVTNEDGFLLNFKPAQTLVDDNEGKTWIEDRSRMDEDESQFLRLKRELSSHYIEGSGSNDVDDFHVTTDSTLSPSQMENEEILLGGSQHTDDKIEGSGEGSGFGMIINTSENEIEDTIMPVTKAGHLYTNSVNPFFGNDVVEADTEIPKEMMPEKPTIFMGSADWINDTTDMVTTPSSTTIESIEEPGGAEKIQIQKTLSEQTAETKEDDKPTVHRTGTYVCVVIIVVLLVGLIGFAVVKGQMRRQRDRRLQRQQKRDVERASKEMVDMNTSLLGKPAPTITIAEKKSNGKYELVPTHDFTSKKGENGVTTSSVDSNKEKGSPRDNNQNREDRPNSILNHLTSVGASNASPEKKQRGSLSSDDIFVPDNEGPISSGMSPSDVSQPFINGANTNDSDYLSPSREYVPVYSPDMGRVRIKLTETPKPKTPVLVNRSRSNAGDIIVTPSLEQSVSKPTT